MWSGLGGVRVDAGEVELAGDEEQHGAHGGEAGITAGFAFGGTQTRQTNGFIEPSTASFRRGEVAGPWAGTTIGMSVGGRCKVTIRHKHHFSLAL